jgi:hypothetical protein
MTLARLRPRTMRPYLTMPQLGVYLGYQPKNADQSAHKWCKRTGIPRKWRGKAWLVHPDDVDAVLDGEQISGKRY